MKVRDEAVVMEIFRRAAEMPPAQRPAFLDAQCNGDSGLRSELDSLLGALDGAHLFLAEPAVRPTQGSDSDVPSEGPGTRIGRYTLIELLGEGGFGSVFRALQEQPVSREVALKIVKLGMDTRQVIARFRIERQALAVMAHPNIARVFDAGATETGRPYFVMEMVPGIPITEYSRAGKLPLRQRLDLFLQVCRGVQHAHQKGIIHRDLKPSNILVTLVDQKPAPKIIDFGIAKATTPEVSPGTRQTHPGALVGTPEYMSPEQATGGTVDVDTRTDIYSLGVILYELLTGTLPFDSEMLRNAGPQEAARIIRTAEPQRPSTRLILIGRRTPENMVSGNSSGEVRLLCRQIRGDLDWIVLKAMEKDPARRYESAAALAADLDRYLCDEPILARAPGAGYRTAKLFRRHKLFFIAAACVLLALILGIVGTTVELMKVRRAQWSTELERGNTETALILSEAHLHWAEQESDDAKALREVVLGVLSRALPNSRGTGQDVHVLDLLDAASAQIAQKLKDQPETEVRMRAMLASTYGSMGKHRQAEENLRRAYELSRNLNGGADSERTMKLAGDLAYYDGMGFASRTYLLARRKFGENHPVTENAANSLASWLARRGENAADGRADLAQAETMYRRLVDQVLRASGRELPTDAYRYIANLASVLNSQGKFTEAAAFGRQMIDRTKDDPRPGIVARARLGQVYVTALAEQGRFADAAAVAPTLLEMHRRTLGMFHPSTMAMLRLYAKVLRGTGRPIDADELLQQALRNARTMHGDGDDDDLADLLVTIGRSRLDDLRVDEGLPLLTDAARMYRRLHGVDDPVGRSWLREALLVTIGSKRQPADGSARAHVFCALEDLFRDHPEVMPDPARFRPGDVRYRIVRWDGQANESVASGTLESAPNGPNLTPGVYLLSLDVDGGGPGTLHQVTWMFVTDWDARFFTGTEVGRFSPATWSQVLAGGAAFRESVPALAFMNTLRSSPAPSADSFAVTATTALHLPQGRYRFLVTSDDAARLYVDGRRAINAWTSHGARRDFADVDLDAGQHVLNVEYFQRGNRFALWVRIQPLCDAANEFASSFGAEPLRTLRRALQEQQEEIHRPEALAARANLFVQLGKLKEAGDDYAAAVDYDPSEPLWWQQAALLRLLNDDREGYQELRTKLLEHFGHATDRITAARTALAVLLDPQADPALVTELLRSASPDGAPPSSRGICQLAGGIGAYRAGRFDAAAKQLAEASAGRLTAQGKVCAAFFQAMALWKSAHPDEARSVYRAATAAATALPPMNQVELDTTEVQDRVIFDLAARQAAEMFAHPKFPS